tara:strand:+ start:108 stop:2081 length:1974 start_codon:yes stop_codon:yes gene_type:complete
MMPFMIFIAAVPLLFGLKELRSRLKMSSDISRILPSEQIQKHMNDAAGKQWSYGDLFEYSKKDLIDAVTIASDGKTAIALDKQHNGIIDGSNFHIIKLFPDNVDNLLNSLTSHNINVDMFELPSNGISTFLSKFCDAMYNIAIYYFAITFIIGIIARFVQLPNQPGSGLSIFNRIQNKGDIIDAKSINTTFADVAGCDEAKFELMEVVDFLKNKEKYQDAGAKIPKGVLLEGNPGTGKTLLARAVAGEAEVPFISASGSEFIELYVGIGASRVRTLFETAKENAPCVIFIDEIDAIGRKRGAGIAGGNDEREQTLNQILTNMDGFSITDGIVVIAATNRIDVLDSALIRPGRFDRKVRVGLPDTEGRKKIFNVHLKEKKIAKEFNLDELVSLTTGFSGADIANLVNEAAIYSVRSNNTNITQENALDAYEKITIGLPSTTNNPEEKEVELVSYHEVGHAYMVSLFKEMFDLRKVTIKENKNGAGGYTLFTPKERFQKYATKRFILSNLIIALGGRAAEVYLYRKKKTSSFDKDIFRDFKDLDVTTGAMNDLKQANEMAKKYITEYGFGESLCYIKDEPNEHPFFSRDVNTKINSVSDDKKCSIDNQTEYLVDFAYKTAYKLIEENAESFEQVVTILKEKKIITGQEVHNIINKNADI